MIVQNINAVVGEWTSNVKLARAQALAEEKKVMVVVCGLECGNCKSVEDKVFITTKFLNLAKENNMYIVYLTTRTSGYISYVTGASGLMPYISLYNENGEIVSKRFNYVDPKATPESFMNLILGKFNGVAPVVEVTSTPAVSVAPATKPAATGFWAKLFGRR